MTIEPAETQTRISATFRIMGRDLEPQAITDLLGIAPDDSHHRGDEHRGMAGRVYAKFGDGLWSIVSRARPNADISTHIRNLIVQLQPLAAELRSIRLRGLDMDVFVGIFAQDCQTGFDLSPELLRSVADLGLRLDFDIYTTTSSSA